MPSGRRAGEGQEHSLNLGLHLRLKPETCWAKTYRRGGEGRRLQKLSVPWMTVCTRLSTHTPCAQMLRAGGASRGEGQSDANSTCKYVGPAHLPAASPDREDMSDKGHRSHMKH